jgi:putative ABC transport system permease protein
MASLSELLRMLALNLGLAVGQLRADPRFVCLTAFGVIIGTAVLVAAMGVAAMAQERLSVIREEIGTQAVYLSVSTASAEQFQRRKARLIDEQALSALGNASGMFTRQATYLRGAAMLTDKGVQRNASVVGMDAGDLAQLAIVLASGRPGGPDDCYLDAFNVPLSNPRTLRLNASPCVLSGTFWQAGFLRSMLSRESGAVVLTSFDKAFAVMGYETTRPSLVVALRLRDETDAFAVLAQINAFMQERYPNLQFSVDWPGVHLLPLNQLLDQVRLVAVLVGALILLISAVAMANAMLAQIGQRRREFGIRLAIGATPRDLVLQTLFEVLGIFGGGRLVGFAAALSIMYAWCHFSGWSFTVSPWLFLLSAGVTFFCALCSGLYPALSAAGIEPIEAMQAT